MDKLIEYNDKLVGLPGGVLVFLFCICVGYMLKLLPPFPNRYIPFAVVSLATVAFLMLAPTRLPETALRIWIGRSIITGMIIGTCSWMAHKMFLKKIEEHFGWFEELPAEPSNGAATEPTTKETP